MRGQVGGASPYHPASPFLVLLPLDQSSQTWPCPRTMVGVRGPRHCLSVVLLWDEDYSNGKANHRSAMTLD